MITLSQTSPARVLLLVLLLCSPGLHAADWRVCALEDSNSNCTLRGYPGLQQAVDGAMDGDRIILGPGIYHPESFFDVGFDELVIRGGVLVEGKTLEIRGEPGAILDGSQGPPVSAVLVHKATVEISGLEIRDFRLGEAEDDLYDGHGIFIINSKVDVVDTQLIRLPKMSVSIFGNSAVKLSGIQVLSGHVGIWAEGTAQTTIENSVFSGNDSAAVAAYAQTQTRVLNSVFENSEDDGVYAKENATVSVLNSIFIGNKPYAIRAEGEATISVNYSNFFQNEALFFPADGSGQLTVGEFIYQQDPQLDPHYFPASTATPLTGDPAIHQPDGTVAHIGLYVGPSNKP